MKLFLAVVLALSGAVGNAAWLPPGEGVLSIPTENGRSLKGYRFGACDYWQLIGGVGTGGSQYACNFYPQRITVADGYDTAEALDAAMKKIEALEARVAELEKKVP